MIKMDHDLKCTRRERERLDRERKTAVAHVYPSSPPCGISTAKYYYNKGDSKSGRKINSFIFVFSILLALSTGFVNDRDSRNQLVPVSYSLSSHSAVPPSFFLFFFIQGSAVMLPWVMGAHQIEDQNSSPLTNLRRRTKNRQKIDNDDIVCF